MDRILIIEDDDAIASLERDYLSINGFVCDIAARGPKGLELALENDYSLIIIDVMLPGMDGYDICTRIREKKQTPIIFLSAKGDDIDKIRGLGLGADDYMTKPFSPNELVARVKAHIGRYCRLAGAPGSAVIDAGDIVINTDSRTVISAGSEVTLTAKEYDLLLYLAQNPNHVFSKETLFDKIWGFDAVGDVSTVTVHIQRLREKVDRREPRHIETVWGVGYRFRK